LEGELKGIIPPAGDLSRRGGPVAGLGIILKRARVKPEIGVGNPPERPQEITEKIINPLTF
jgi:hypothetical protein